MYTCAFYTNPENTMIRADISGITSFFPCAPGNADYARIQELVAAGELTIADYVPPPPPVPQSITRRQLLLILPATGVITAQEALAAAQTGAVPAVIQSYFALLSDSDRIAAEITWATMSMCERDNPLVLGLAAQMGLTNAQVDEFFHQASVL